MERAVSGRIAAFSGIVEAGRGGGGQAPTGGLGQAHHGPTGRKHEPLSARYPPVVSSLGETRVR